MLGVFTLSFALCAGAAQPRVETLHPARWAAGLLADNRSVDLRRQQDKTDQALAQRERAATAARIAAKARDDAASTVTRLKQEQGFHRTPAPVLETALQQALARDEAAAQARSSVAAADVVVAREGARLLRLYDAILADRRRSIDAAPLQRRAALVEPYRALVAQRDAVRSALAPLLTPALEAPLAEASLEVGVDDDVEVLLEKADLARDLEARLRRRAASVHRRISELKDEAALEGDVAAAVARGQLFDEEDRRLVVTTRSELNQARAVNGPNGARSPSPEGVVSAPPIEQNDGVDDGSVGDVGFSVPAAAPLTTSTVSERPVALPTELLNMTPSTMSALLALDAELKRELEALAKKQAALKKATAERR